MVSHCVFLQDGDEQYFSNSQIYEEGRISEGRGEGFLRLLGSRIILFDSSQLSLWLTSIISFLRQFFLMWSE